MKLDIAAAQFHWEVPNEELVESNENYDAKMNMFLETAFLSNKYILTSAPTIVARMIPNQVEKIML